jgi:UDP-2,3-diacylglucosamine hydrolase
VFEAHITSPPKSLAIISDLHLWDEADAQHDGPATIAAFTQFAQHVAQRDDCAALIVIGDLFEVWIGDDAPASAASSAVSNAFLTLRRSGKRVYVMHGNRDFLLNAQFVKQSHCLLLPDVVVVHYGNHRIALVHGDAQCTDDLPYQQFRRMVREDKWQEEFLRKPIAERQAMARAIRSESEHNKSQQGYTDVNANAVRALMQHTQCPTLIHGHTHEGKSHRMHGLPQWPDAARHVTQDWDARSRRGDALWVTPNGIVREAIF